MNDWNFGDYQVRVGSSRASTRGTIFEVDTMVPHPDYFRPAKNLDFLLIKLKKTIPFNDRQQAIKMAAAGKSIAAGEQVLSSGFGNL